jgi:hypothetical protein
MRTDPADERVLRAKYFDWCSARVADRFLRLSPDEIYELAQQASRDASEEPESQDGWQAAKRPAEEGVAIPADGSPIEAVRTLWQAAAVASPIEGTSYRTVVARVAEVLAQRLSLPSFEEWRAAFLAAPDQYEPELLGLWRDAF